MITAEEYKQALVPDGKQRVSWTMETFSTYINLLYPHITFVVGQEWVGAKAKYKFLCEKHGEYEAFGHNLVANGRGCQCQGCAGELTSSKAGKSRRPKSTKEERDRAAQLYAELQNYEEVARILGRDGKTIRKWLDPKTYQREREYYREWANENRDKVRAATNRYATFAHGKAVSREGNAARRLLRSNAPWFVFLDGEWHEVDRAETVRVFKDALLSPLQRMAINRIFHEAQKLIEQTGIDYHIDHIQPLSKGGEHLAENLQILTAEENLKKHNNFRIEDQQELCNRLFRTKS